MIKDINYCLFGYSFFEEHLEKLKSQFTGVYEGKDIEFLHKMRVESRRLLSGVKTFECCFPEDDVDEVIVNFKSLASALGRARDADVQTDTIKNYLAHTKNRNRVLALERLVLRLSQKRALLQDQVITGYQDFINWEDEFNILKTIRKECTLRVSSGDVTLTPEFFENIAERTKFWVDIIHELSYMIFDPKNVEELHELRKANKQLRYTLETFIPIMGEDFKPFLDEFVEIQDSIGQIHDYDVWIEFLPQFINKEKDRTIKYYGSVGNFSGLEKGFIGFSEMLTRERRKEYSYFIQKWRGLEKSNFFGRLLETAGISDEHFASSF
ncbi:MAG: CHAD domain-containing protein [Ignavibacteriales bacterium]|nr:CHAD domain-containing protein [Ignavibacteriales bacterium]MCF8315742.1 CHAD domain-containing protein [Ignavibacteriales bacterium]MCF8437064.1 CHAD domain-containing protein [Ignavibacteriales bacterium]